VSRKSRVSSRASAPVCPPFTRFVFNVSRGLRSLGLYVLIGLTASAYALSHFRKPSELMRDFFSRLSLTTLNIVMLSIAAMVMAIVVAMLLPIFTLAPAS
jgi:type II secretory pathway component PulF